MKTQTYGMHRSFRIFLFILILLLLILVNNLRINAQTDSSFKPYPKIMIIPYNTANYLSDVDMSGVIYNDGTPFGEYCSANKLIRYNLEKVLYEDLMLYFDPKRVLFYDNLTSMQKDLDRIYASINYSMKAQRLKAYYRNFPEFTIFQILGSEENRWGVNCVDDRSRMPVVKNPRITFYDVSIKDTSLIPYLSSRYKCDYFLFVNGFELKTRFKICMDLLSNVKQKDIILHFTLFDNKSKKLIGGLVGITYEPEYNDIFDIAENNLGILSGLVTNIIKTRLGLSLRYDVGE